MANNPIPTRAMLVSLDAALSALNTMAATPMARPMAAGRFALGELV